MSRDRKEYIAYEAPDGTIIIDWDGNAWKVGLYMPYYGKAQCKEIGRGEVEGGPAVVELWVRLKKEHEFESQKRN